MAGLTVTEGPAGAWDAASCAIHNPNATHSHTGDRAITTLSILCGEKKRIQREKNWEVHFGMPSLIHKFDFGKLLVGSVLANRIESNLGGNPRISGLFLPLLTIPRSQ